MISGTYSVTMKTPKQVYKGVVVLEENNGQVSGSLQAMGTKSTFSNGKVNGNEFEVSGTIRQFIFSIPYTVKGTVNGNTLEAVADTSFGKYTISGQRV